ncbi:alpha/beta hydrolase [Actinokineospora sp. 24-640]
MPELMSRVPIGAQAVLARAVFAAPKPIRRLIAGAPIRVDGQELALDAQLLLALDRIGGHELAHGTPEEARARMARAVPLVSGPPIEPVAVRGLSLDGIPARLYTPVEDTSAMLVYYHGGGWVIGTLDSHDNTCRYLAREAGVKVLSVDYRLAPEHPFPAAVEDAVAAFRHAHAKAADFGVEPGRIAVGGDSAGGNLAAVASLLTTRDGGSAPAFQLLFYPGADSTVRRPSRDLFADGFFLTSDNIDWFSDHYCPELDLRTDPRFSVLLAADLSGLPPAYLATAGFDPLRDEGEAFGAKLAEAGVPVTVRRHRDLIHGYATFLGIGTRFREAVAEAAGALRTGLALARR